MKIRRPNWRWRAPLGKRIGDPPYIILHNVGGNSSPEAIHAYHRDVLKWLGIAYHEHIDFDGTVTIGRPKWAMGGHCHGYNDGYGIVVNGNYDEREEMTDAQYASLVARVTAAQKEWPQAKIREHGDMPGNATSCAGQNFPIDQLKRDVAKALNKPKKFLRRDRPRLKVLMRDYAREAGIEIPKGFGWRLPNWGKPARVLAWRISGRINKTQPEVKQSQWATVELAAALGMKKYQ